MLIPAECIISSSLRRMSCSTPRVTGKCTRWSRISFKCARISRRRRLSKGPCRCRTYAFDSPLPITTWPSRSYWSAYSSPTTLLTSLSGPSSDEVSMFSSEPSGTAAASWFPSTTAGTPTFGATICWWPRSASKDGRRYFSCVSVLSIFLHAVSPMCAEGRDMIGICW